MSQPEHDAYAAGPRTLEVEDLHVSVGEDLVAVRGVSFQLRRGEAVGLVGA